jgi:hypothetical protein
VAVHIYTQTIHRTTHITTDVEEWGPCPVFASCTLAFALQLRKKARKNLRQRKKNLSWVKKTSVRVQYTYTYSIYIYKKHARVHTHTK